MFSYSPRPMEDPRGHFSLITLLCLHWSVKIIKTIGVLSDMLTLSTLSAQELEHGVSGPFTLFHSVFKHFSKSLSFFKFGNHFHCWCFFVCDHYFYPVTECTYNKSKPNTSTSWMPACPIKLFCKLGVDKTVWFCRFTVDLFVVFDHELWYLYLENVNKHFAVVRVYLVSTELLWGTKGFYNACLTYMHWMIRLCKACRSLISDITLW